MFGSINIHSAVKWVGLVHTINANNNIDLLALQETWINADDPKAMQADVAPVRYSVFDVQGHQPRSCCRLHSKPAIVFRQELNVTAHRLQSTSK